MIAFVADCHIGNRAADGGITGPDGLNVRGRESVATFARALRLAGQQEAGATFVVAGDLFHSRRPEPAVIAAVQRALAIECESLNVEIIPGNHDMEDSTAFERNTACETLWQSAAVVARPCWHTPSSGEGRILQIPFQSARPMAEYLTDEVPKLAAELTAKGPRLLVTHVGCWDETDPPWLRDARDGMEAKALLALLDKHGFELGVVGNFHHHRNWTGERAKLVQIGTLCPGSHSDQGMFPDVGGMLLWRAKKGIEMVEVPGPRFVPNDSDEVAMAEGCVLRVQGDKAGPAQDERALAPAVGAEEAISTFVATIPLPEGVAREEVLGSALEFYKGVEA